MSKKQILVTIENDEDKRTHHTMAIIGDNNIKYKEKDNTTVIFDYNNKTLIRDNEELSMHYKFSKTKKTTGTILIKELNKKLTLEIKTTNLIIENNNVEISFIIENNKFVYKIEVIK